MPLPLSSPLASSDGRGQASAVPSQPRQLGARTWVDRPLACSTARLEASRATFLSWPCSPASCSFLSPLAAMKRAGLVALPSCVSTAASFSAARAGQASGCPAVRHQPQVGSGSTGCCWTAHCCWLGGEGKQVGL